MQVSSLCFQMQLVPRYSVVLFRDYAEDDVKNGGGGGGEDAGSNPGRDSSRGGGGGKEEEEGGASASGSATGTGTATGAAAGTSFNPGEKVGRDTYVRGDGTLAVFTDEAAVEVGLSLPGVILVTWTMLAGWHQLSF
jgi:hypothetical protein